MGKGGMNRDGITVRPLYHEIDPWKKLLLRGWFVITFLAVVVAFLLGLLKAKDDAVLYLLVVNLLGMVSVRNLCISAKMRFLLAFMVCCHDAELRVHFCEPHLVNRSTVNCPTADSTVVDQIFPNAIHPEFISVYSFPRTPISKVDCFHEDLLKLIQLNKPVVLTNCTFFNQTLKWDFNYLSKELIDEYSVTLSNSRKFLYYDTTADYTAFRETGWKPAYEVRYKSFDEFLAIASELTKANNGSHAYLQTLLLSEDRNSSVKDDLNHFDYSWIIRLAFELGWSTNVINMLFVGMPTVVTPAHYDMMENLFIQVRGKKRFILLSPDQFSNLYPYPVGHPHDRHSQVDFDDPDFERFPKFRHVRAFEAIVEPGDALYVPVNWWHHVEANRNNFTVSLNFWFEDRVPNRIPDIVKESASSETPILLSPAEDLAFKRYIESIVYNVTKSFTKVKKVFEDLSSGRFSV